MLTGYGRSFFSNSDYFIGHWKNNKRQGYGEMHRANGTVEKGIFDNNRFIGAKFTVKDEGNVPKVGAPNAYPGGKSEEEKASGVTSRANMSGATNRI